MFALVWALGGVLVGQELHGRFDIFLRQLLQTERAKAESLGVIPFPTEGTVYVVSRRFRDCLRLLQ